MKQARPNRKKPNSQDMASPADPLGSYTGAPADPTEKPTQDADDL